MVLCNSSIYPGMPDKFIDFTYKNKQSLCDVCGNFYPWCLHALSVVPITLFFVPVHDIGDSARVHKFQAHSQLPYFTDYKTYFFLRKIASKIHVCLILEINIKMSSV
jgi:hypothetical protein